MMKSLKVALVAAAAVGGAATMTGTASAMPLSAVGSTATRTADVQDVRYVCGPFRCFYRPGFVYRGFYGPRRFYGRRFGFGYGRFGYYR